MAISPCLLYIVFGGNPNFTPHLLTAPTFAVTNSPSLSCTCLELRKLLALAMEGEGSPVIDNMGDAPKGPLPEASMASSSSDASSSGAASNVAETEVEIFVDPRELVRSYEFGASSVTVGCICQMESLGYFTEGSVRETGEEIVPEPNSDKVVVFEEFFTTGLRMSPHRVFTEILLKFWVQLHQQTLNAITQMSKYFWAVLSFGGELSSDGFAKRYELHYQPKKVPDDGFDKYQQFGVVNFHGKRGGEVGLILATKNKWLVRWMKAWFHCKVPLHLCPHGGKTVHTLRSHLSALSFHAKLITIDTTQDLNDDAFIWASQNIRGQDVVEEFLPCGVWRLSAGVNFEHVKVDFTSVSQLKILLPNFPLRHEDEEDDVKFLARVEQEAKNIVGSYTCTEHEACITSIPNNGRLNRVLEIVGVSCGPDPVPISAEVLKKREADGAVKVSGKRPKVVERKVL
jgi:hypothetical protein